MNTSSVTSCTAFSGKRLIASGCLLQVALKAQEAAGRDKFAQVLIFEDTTSNLVEVDLRGTPDDLSCRIAETQTAAAQTDEPIPADGEARKPGRPKLGVVAREVTLLPRHWEWLASQPGGASVALRKLVEQAKKANQGTDRVRIAQEAAYRFMSAMCGNEAGFEEANRALFAGNRERFEQVVELWPTDLRDHAKKLASLVFVS
jgi:uncharacterized protein